MALGSPLLMLRRFLGVPLISSRGIMVGVLPGILKEKW
jgi:hypothetical protein